MKEKQKQRIQRKYNLTCAQDDALRKAEQKSGMSQAAAYRRMCKWFCAQYDVYFDPATRGRGDYERKKHERSDL